VACVRAAGPLENKKSDIRGGFEMQTSRLTLVAGAFMCAAGAAFAQQQPVTMKMTGIAVNDPAHLYMKQYKEKIEARTNGRIKVEIYPGAQLGGFPQMVQGVTLGTLEFFMGPPGFLRGLDPRVQIADAPGLFQDMEHGQRTMTDPRFRDKFLELTTPKGVKGITLFNVGPTSYAANVPLRKLDDFRGKKFRVLATKVEVESMNRIGASGVPLDFAEVLAALTNRTLDGARSSIVVMGPMKFYTVTKYLTTVADTMIPVGGYVSMGWLGKLPPDLQTAVVDTGKELEDWVFKAAVEHNESGLKAWREAGGEVINLSPADQAEFMRRLSPVGDEVYGADPVLGEMYRLYKQVAESQRKKAS
jgi:TRAP-type C4-dicarboxylate transport system substrate-binding protein